MQTTKQRGNYGENAACKFLVDNGYKILERNFCFGHQEIDIIALDSKKVLAFIEVRSRKEGLCSPEESIDWRKQRNIIRVAQFYLKVKNLNDYPCRFDVVVILYKDDSVDIEKIELIKDAFQVN